MNIFEPDRIFDRVIIERGRKYYEDGNIIELNRPDAKRCNALVKGTEFYRVNVELSSSGEVSSMSCTCPYARTSYCKHEAAVLMALENDYLNADTISDLKSSLEKCTKEELVEIVLASVRDEHYIISRLLYNAERMTTTDVFKRFSLGLGEAKTKYGYINSKVAHITDEALAEVEALEDHTEQTRVILGILRALNEAEDSWHDDDYSFCDMMDDAARVMAEVNNIVMDSGSPADISAQWTAMMTARTLLDFYDDEKRWFDILLPFGKNEAYLKELFSLAEQAEYQRTDIRLMMADTYYSDSGLDAFIEENSDNNEILYYAYKREMDRSNYDEAERFALLGKERDTECSLKWLAALRDIYKAANDLERLSSVLYDMVLAGSTESFTMIKQTLTEQQYTEALERLLKEPKNLSYEFIIDQENLYDLMIEHCRQHESSIVTMAEKLASSEYHKQARSVFAIYIRRKAALANNRNDYAEIASLLKKYLWCFGKAEGDSLSGEIRQKYGSRPAFMDEMDKAGV